MAGRTIAIGDVHGCSRALAALLDAICPGPEDTVVTLGDYIDRGPDSRGVLDQLITLAEHCRLVPLLGNHEEMLVAALSDREALKLWLACGGVETVASYGYGGPGSSPGGLVELIPEGHWAFLATCRTFYETDTHLFVHAGYLPDLPMEPQPGEILRWQYADRRTAKPHYSGKTVVVGHTPQRGGEILDLEFLKCIDTCCHAGRWLTALEVHTGQVWQANQRGQLRGNGEKARAESGQREPRRV